MRLCLVRKEDLAPEQLEKIGDRLQCSARLEGECGPIRAWNIYTNYLYAFLTAEGKMPIGIAEASGRPTSLPGWWIDPIYRNQKYGNELVDLLAQHLKSDGVTVIGRILIQTQNGQYDMQSKRLVARLRGHF